MLVNRQYPKVGDKVSGTRVAYNEEATVKGTVTRVDRFRAGNETLTNVDVMTSEGYEDWFGWDENAQIIEAVDDGKAENGYCNICHSYCWGDCEANGLRPSRQRVTFAPYHKGDTGTVHEI